MPQASVVIVGGGASGLSAAGALRRRGIEAVVLEGDEQLGGTWARRYDRLHLHTVRGFSGLAHFMGYTHSLRGHLFEANLASRRLARNVERYLQSQETTQ